MTKFSNLCNTVGPCFELLFNRLDQFAESEYQSGFDFVSIVSILQLIILIVTAVLIAVHVYLAKRIGDQLFIQTKPKVTSVSVDQSDYCQIDMTLLEPIRYQA